MQLLTATVYLLDDDGIPIHRTIETIWARDADDFRVKTQARYSGPIEFGPIGTPWSKDF